MKKLISGALVALSALSLSSCLIAAAGAGAAGAVYVEGKYSENLDGNVKKVSEVATKTIKDDDSYVFVSSTGVDTNKAEIFGDTKSSKPKKVEVTVEYLTDDASKVTVRVGTFGDEAESRALLEKIKANL